MRTVNEILTQVAVAKQRINELYIIIYNEVNSDADLSGLDSTSKTAEFNLWMFVWAAMALIQEQFWAEAKSEIQAIADNAISGTDPWFQKEVLKFQFGDALLLNSETGNYYYAVIDEAKKIIKRCALVSGSGTTIVKVAKETAGVPVQLTAPELSALKTYVDRIQFAGANIQVTSTASDKLNAPITVYYDGTADLIALKAAVESAFLIYIANLKFNGEYSITKHQDAIQAVANVNDVVMGNIEAKASAGSYAPVNRVYFPASGYIERDATIDFDDMITYIPQ